MEMPIEEIKKPLQDRPRAWVDKLGNRDPLPELAPSSDWDSYLTSEISAASPEEIFVEVPADLELALCFQSGLLLWNDALEPSHTLSQSLHSATGSYWHGIMHRREPDFGNAKYWFRKVGDHAAYRSLAEAAVLLLRDYGDGYSQTFKSELEVGGWDAFGFVDRCEKAVRGKEPPEVVDLLEKIQEMEIKNLLLWCLQNG